MIKPTSAIALVAALLATGLPARAQQQQMLSPGARAGNSVIPSTHSPGCSGVLCDSDDPRRIANVQPPPCQGLICSLTPYGMTPPTAAAAAAQAQEQQARVEAAAAPAAPPPEARSRKSRRAKARSSKTVAARTPDTSASPPTR